MCNDSVKKTVLIFIKNFIKILSDANSFYLCYRINNPYFELYQFSLVMHKFIMQQNAKD